MKSRASLPTCALLLLAATPAMALAAGDGTQKDEGKTYRWVDKNKVKQYGDTVPPEYAKQESAILNSHGVEVGKVNAQRTPEQIAEEDRRLQEIARGRQHDQFLLTTYTSVKDIEQLRDERLGQLEGQISASQTYQDSLLARLRALQSRAQSFKPYSENAQARRMPDQLAEEIVRAANEGRAQHAVLESKRREQAVLRAQFQTDIDRFHKLVTEQRAATATAR